MFNHLDHVAILVKDTEEALTFYRDTLKLELLLSEELPEVGVRLTHLNAGNVKLQLVQPLSEDHPLQSQLAEKGEHIHHLCWGVDDTRAAMAKLADYQLAPKPNEPHPAPQNGEAAFIEPSQTRGVLWEMTARPTAPSEK
ncbi:VOC family protein [Roseibacillus persicicus]|uniref:Methylmalonyl-CoA epimerase n=1 Tax=Roseibacillus persicicus TaxID=454148 RepID=A0A918TT88_9BACT|nr:VOC family protein [Roseibacillus persicicus]MDQ8189849.1 VOC family protein [Roseibacillus persicicus]GHC62367.1 methylmalonyl-CoA epimerase [Roseibacillus persicicus]